MGKDKTFCIVEAIPYVNARPHLGFAFETVQADAIARFHRALGEDVFFLVGTDENSLKNVLAAREKGLDTKKFVDQNASVFRDLKGVLNLSPDDFIRTTDERHIRGAQKLWSACKPGDIYKKSYQGLYCVGCEEFKLSKELIDGRCSEHPSSELEEVQEENYFFRLSAYQKRIEKLIASDELWIVPETRKNEVLSFVRQGLQDFSISRSRERAGNWGVPVPGDPSQIQYVWFDALTNYINALGYADDAEAFRHYWQDGDYVMHVVGKGITRFHAVYWPAMLLSAGVALPDAIFVHGYITIGGEKISKSLGNVIDPLEASARHGVDALRYWFLREMNTFEDGDFTWEKFDEAYSAHLQNGLGNLVSRILTMVSSYNVELSLPGEGGSAAVQEELRAKVREAMDAFELGNAMNVIWEEIHGLDRMIQKTEPFKLVKRDKEKAQEIVRELALRLFGVGAALEPFMPETSEKIVGAVREGRPPSVLFPRKD